MKKLIGTLAVLAACGGGEAVSVELSVVAGTGHIDDATTNLGYTVSVDNLRVAISDLQFTTDGGEHEVSLASRVGGWLVGTAHAHPGHAGGGEVLGELLGDYIVDWSSDGSTLGQATLLTGTYNGSNFLFREATEADGLEADDPLLGHTIALSGTITRATESWTYSMVFDVEAATALVGAPFRYDLTEESLPTIALELATIDFVDGDTIFDGIEFADLDPDADGHIAIEPGQTAHNALRRSFTKHDFYLVETR